PECGLPGASVRYPADRILALHPIKVSVSTEMAYTQISPEFIGTDEQVTMILVNKGDGSFPLRKGPRLSNTTGIIFRIQNAVIVPAHGTVPVLAIADHTDMYGKPVGDRGNVQPGMHWDLPALRPEDQMQVYAENKNKGTGGTSAFRNALQ